MHGMIYGQHIYSAKMSQIKRQASRIANNHWRKPGCTTDHLVVACDKGHWEFERKCKYWNHYFTHGDWVEIKEKSYLV